MGLTPEVCVDTGTGLAEAVAGRADRIEPCAALALGGLTPSAGLMAKSAVCPVPVVVMIRPRAGDFVWSETRVGMREAEIAATRVAGLAGVVLGTPVQDGRLDVPVLRHLIAVAGAMDLTLHRTIDLSPDMGGTGSGNRTGIPAHSDLGWREDGGGGSQTDRSFGDAGRKADSDHAGVGGDPGEPADADGAWHGAQPMFYLQIEAVDPLCKRVRCPLPAPEGFAPSGPPAEYFRQAEAQF